MSDDNISETTSPSPVGTGFVVEACPECGVINTGPSIPWHTMDCSEPDMEKYVAQIVGRFPEDVKPVDPASQDFQR